MKTAVLQNMTSCSLVDRYPEDSSRIFPSMVHTHGPGTRCHLPENRSLRSHDVETFKFQGTRMFNVILMINRVEYCGVYCSASLDGETI